MSRFNDQNRGGGRGGAYGQGASNYSNGYGNSGTNPYGNDSYGASGGRPVLGGPPPSAGGDGGPRAPFRARERRQGGYGAPSPAIAGGFSASRENLIEEDRPQVNRPTSLERSVGKRRSDGTPWSQRSPTRKQYAGDGTSKINEVISYIQRDWDFMTDEKCVPVQVALQLMDDSSLGLAGRYTQFMEIHEQLQNALRAIVNEHHQGFNSSIGTFHNIQESITLSQGRLRGLRDSLVEAKMSLATTKPELKGLATSSQDYDDMLKVLGSMYVADIFKLDSFANSQDREHLQGIPEKLEARISEKRFLSAVELLQDALKTMRNSDMDGIGALSDLRVYLSNQEHVCSLPLQSSLHSAQKNPDMLIVSDRHSYRRTPQSPLPKITILREQVETVCSSAPKGQRSGSETTHSRIEGKATLSILG
jgi:exocyst complex component 4